MKILHAADLHLDSPFAGRSAEQADRLKNAMRRIPRQLTALCREEGCDLVLLAGDLFDGPWSRDSFRELYTALEQMQVPVFISPGNHDHICNDSPYWSEVWPENVHIFTRPEMGAVPLPELNCRIYGAGYRSMDCDALLEGFRAEGEEQYHIAVLHGDPTAVQSPYSPISADQLRKSGLHYAALGHVHKSGQLRAGQTLCAWPGCPMGRGFDELDAKGVLIVTLDDAARAEFVALDTPRFFDYETDPGFDAQSALARLLPAAGDDHFYRVTFTGEAEAPDLDALQQAFSQFPNLQLRDRTMPLRDIWGSATEDTLEGVYFSLLKDALEQADEEQRQILTLAARISRQLLDGQEVRLP
jgi:DNA repair exonuclease SbcCD nuclease subunit